MSCHFCRARAPFYDALRGVMGSLGAEIPAGFYGWRKRGRPRKARRHALSALWVRLCKQTAYCMPRTWFAVGVIFTLHTNRHPPFRLAKSRLRRLLAGRPLRWVSQFSITSIPTKMLALRPLYANGEKYYAVRRNLSKNDNAICGILLYNKAISENLVV